MFGGSFKVKIGADQFGFLHKIHTHDLQDENESDDGKKKEPKELEAG